MTKLERAWAALLNNAGVRPGAIDALVAVLDRRHMLDALKQRAWAEAAAELRADEGSGAPHPHGKLGKAVALIEAGEAKDAILARGISRRTFYRARQQCQSANTHRSGCHAS